MNEPVRPSITRSFIRGCGWTLLIYGVLMLVAILVGVALLAGIPLTGMDNIYPGIGILVALVLAHRSGYRLDWIDWVCGFIPVFGWTVLFWRRDYRMSNIPKATNDRM